MSVEVATRGSWKTEPLPEARARLAYTRSFAPGERARLVRGIVPAQMEDKWFVFHEPPWLYFHRSWTGICIYALRLSVEGEGCAVDEAWVNRAPAQYREKDDAHDVAILSFLVERLLLGRNPAFPVRAGVDPARAMLLLHHVVGHARSNDEDA
jgi:hypothetical protein